MRAFVWLSIMLLSGLFWYEIYEITLSDGYNYQGKILSCLIALGKVMIGYLFVIIVAYFSAVKLERLWR